MVRAIKVSDELYSKLKFRIHKDFGNVSMARGLFLMASLYNNYVPLETRKRTRKMNEKYLTKGEIFK